VPTRISVTGRSPRVKMRSITSVGRCLVRKEVFTVQGQREARGPLGLVTDQVSVIAAAMTSYAPVVVRVRY